MLGPAELDAGERRQRPNGRDALCKPNTLAEFLIHSILTADLDACSPTDGARQSCRFDQVRPIDSVH